MSLSKQLLLIVSALFLMVFSLTFLQSVKNTRTYLEGEAKIHAQDTATALGLALTPYIENPQDPVIKGMMNAIFDRGYYKEIRLQDNQQNNLMLLINSKPVQNVPGWFIDFLPITPATAISEISTGWQISATIAVTVNPNYAYIKLYQQSKTTFYYSLAAYLGSILLLFITLRISLASLSRIDKMALSLADGDFVTIGRLPWTSEIRHVANSMNIMSQKIQSTINLLHHKLKSVGDNLLRDDLTGLLKKSVFENDFEHLNSQDDAFFVLVKFDSLPELVKIRNSPVIDQYLKSFASLLNNATQLAGIAPAKAYRFYGAEFALLIEHSHLQAIEKLAHYLSEQLMLLGIACQYPDLGHIGIVRIPPMTSLETVLDTANEAYQQAQLIGANRYFIREKDQSARDMMEWTELVNEYAENRRFNMTFANRIIDLQTKKLLIEEVFIHIIDANKQPIPVAPFIAIAEKTGKIVTIDQGMLKQVFHHLQNTRLDHAILLNISTQSIKNASFRLWLIQQFKTHPGLAKRLIFSLSAYAVSKEISIHQDFIEQIHLFGGQVMIKRYESLSLSSDTLKQLKPDYIRLALELTNDISHHHPKQEFLQTLQTLANLIDTQVLAEVIQNDDDLNTLKKIGIRGANA